MLKLVYGKAQIGGSETLLLRIARASYENGEKVYLYCSDIIDETCEKFLNCGATIIKYKKPFNPKCLEPLTHNDIVLTLGLEHFLKCESYVYDRYSINVYLYVVHPHTLTDWFFVQNPYSFIKHAFRNDLIDFIKNGLIFFMDNECIDETTKYYNDNNIKSYAKIQLLPIKSENINISKIKRKRENNINILSITRADFPFKGYIKGLIDSFVLLKKKYNTLTLTIISYGPQIDCLKKWVSKAGSEANDILLLQSVDYDQLKKYYQLASMYIGMGTTILEAANQGVISIPVESYCMECRARNFFFQDPYRVSVDKGMGIDVSFFIKRVIEINDNEFYNLSLKTKKVFDENYNIKLFLDFIKTHSIYKKKENWIVYLYIRIWTLFYKIGYIIFRKK